MSTLNCVLAVAFVFTSSCATKSDVNDITLNSETQRLDSRGCMISTRAVNAPPMPTAITAAAVELYYEKLEYYFLLAAENCMSDSRRCDEFLSVLGGMKDRFLLSRNFDKASLVESDTLKNSSNKLIAMISMNTYVVQKLHKINFAKPLWLKPLLEANDLTTENRALTVVSENKAYPFAAHNMAATSARAHLFTGIALGEQALIDKGLSQIPAILASVRDDGSLPLETRRGARALRYSMQVLSDIIAMIDNVPIRKELYAKYQTPLLKMANFDLEVLKNNSKIEAYSKDNLSPGPIQDPKVQDISSLRSRLAWIVALDRLEPGYLEKVEDIELDKRACAQRFLKKKPECSPLMQSIGDVVNSPLGFTLGYNPKCATLK